MIVDTIMSMETQSTETAAVCISVGQTALVLAKQAYHQCWTWRVRVQVPSGMLPDFLLQYVIPINGQPVGGFLRVLRFAPPPSCTFK